MPLYSYECKCGLITDKMFKITNKPKSIKCPCGKIAKSIINPSFTPSYDAPWLTSVLEVVDKDPRKAHCQEFLKHPTRSNHKKWMKGEKLRPLEPGEGKAKDMFDEKKADKHIYDGLMRAYKKVNKIEVNHGEI